MRINANFEQLFSTLEANRSQGIGFVPTMGFLHQGHLSLIEASRKQNLYTVVSIFVNPAQFGANEDLDVYPSNPEGDYQLSMQAGADLVWYPSVDNIYPASAQTSVLPGALANKLCGVSRPQFFPGICTVVLKLFNIIRPSHTFFGEKDFQQLTIIRRMVRDFFLPIEVVGCPTVREPDGLAMSSRNANLAPQDRGLALTLYRQIVAAKDAFAAGQNNAEALRATLRANWPEGIDLDYLDFRNPSSLEEETTLTPQSRIFLGAWLNGVRLIDNAALGA